MVMSSDAETKSSSFASMADVETLAIAIVSKAFTTGGIGPPNNLSCKQRRKYSLQPPQPGTKPTPTSTRPVYNSAWACIASQCSRISHPPPKARPDGAATTGKGAYFNAIKVCCPCLIRFSTLSQSP